MSPALTGNQLVDADSGGSAVKATATTTANANAPTPKIDAQAQTEDSQTPANQDILDGQKAEQEVQRLIENHDIDKERLQGNIDFWKGKVNGLISQQKEMLEDKTKLHLELEQSDAALK